MDQKKKKLKTMHKALYPKDNLDNTYQKKKEKDDSPKLKLDWMHQYKDSKTM